MADRNRHTSEQPQEAVPPGDGTLRDEGSLRRFLRERSNHGRWGPDDQVGALNLVDAVKRKQAAALVDVGHSISLSRATSAHGGVANPKPFLHYTRRLGGSEGPGGAVDFYGVDYHGTTVTHIDALCHMWDDYEMWNGRDPDRSFSSEGAEFGGIEHWRNGILTRGFLVDIPAFRGVPYVTQDEPVHGEELRAAVIQAGIHPEPGDAMAVYCGREDWSRDNGVPWGVRTDDVAGLDPGTVERVAGSTPSRPGLHASCLGPLRDWDIAVLLWDMMDAFPKGHDMPYAVHSAIFSFGVALIDNARLLPLAEYCRKEGRHEFMLSVNPLVVPGGTGSPVNPVAYF